MRVFVCQIRAGVYRPHHALLIGAGTPRPGAEEVWHRLQCGVRRNQVREARDFAVRAVADIFTVATADRCEENVPN